MKTIHKIVLNTDSPIQSFKAHRNFKILHFGKQNDTPCLWIEVDIRMDVVEFEVRMFGTGNPLGFDAKTYIGTIMVEPFVWHYYLMGVHKCLK